MSAPVEERTARPSAVSVWVSRLLTAGFVLALAAIPNLIGAVGHGLLMNLLN